jgi:hypothetical protein
MQHFEIDWLAFSRWLPDWRRLSRPVQRHLLTAPMHAASKAADLGEELPLLLDMGVVTAASTNPRYLLHDRARPYIRALRAMYRHRVLDDPTLQTCIAYIQDNLTPAERNALGVTLSLHMLNTHDAAVHVTSAEWVESFIKGKSARVPGDPDTRAGVVSLITHVLAKGPVRIADLPELPVAPNTINRAVGDALRLALLFAAVAEDGEPVLTMWPPTVARLTRPEHGRPQPVQPPTSTFHFPILSEDAAVILITAFAEPLRLRGHDHALFEKAHSRLAAALTPLPEDAGLFVGGWKDEVRINMAVLYLSELQLVSTAGSPGSQFRLEPSATARDWLSQPAGARLRGFMDAFRTACAEDNRVAWHGYDTGVAGRFRGLLADLRRVLEPAAEQYVDAGDLLNYAADQKPPERFNRTLAYSYGRTTLEQREKLWLDTISNFLANVVMPLDGLEFGLQQNRRWAVRLTPAGRYLLGIDTTFIAKHEGPPTGGVIVQPNFDIVFLSASPLAAASIGRFSERIQHGSVGTIFRITRASVQNAASAAITADDVIATLRTVSAQQLPANVEREIRGWANTTRRVTAGTAFLVRCPDEATAAHVVAAAGRHGRLIAPTIVELTDPKQRTALEKKLRAKGIFLSLSAEQPAARR